MTANEILPERKPHLDVVRLGDGRYCVQFVKDGSVPRTSYTDDPAAVAQQAKRAGNIPVRTADAELRRICRDELVELIS